jgi:hypothetical protein
MRVARIMLRTATVGIVLLVQSAAQADTYLVTGSGTWDPIAPTTALSAPDTTWSFSYIETTPLTPEPFGAIGNPTNFSYELGGTPVTEPLSGNNYFPSTDFGLLSLFFTSGDFLQLYGGQVFDSNYNLIPGVYTATIDVNGTNPTPLGEGSGTVTITAVPEPASIALMGLGLVAVAAARRSRPRREAA